MTYTSNHDCRESAERRSCRRRTLESAFSSNELVTNSADKQMNKHGDEQPRQEEQAQR